MVIEFLMLMIFGIDPKKIKPKNIISQKGKHQI